MGVNAGTQTADDDLQQMQKEAAAKETSAAGQEQPSASQPESSASKVHAQADDEADALTLWGEFGQTAEGQVALCDKPITAECCAFEQGYGADDDDLTFYSYGDVAPID